MKHLLAALALLFAFQANAMVKLSTSGNICHSENSPYYDRIVSYTPFLNMTTCYQELAYVELERCIEEGRCYDPEPGPAGYDRESKFGAWDDPDGNCLNTRHQLLAIMSYSDVVIEDCRVVSGNWISHFTNKTITDPMKMDIDHIVPLYHAWAHGADEWTQEKRRAFATDTDNLWPVELSLNRSKADRGLAWLPPENICQYTLKFLNVVEKYGLLYSGSELANHKKIRFEQCGF